MSIGDSPFAAGEGTESVKVDPTGQFVYAANADGTISAYRINGITGALLSIGGSPFAGGSVPISVTTTAGPTLPVP